MGSSSGKCEKNSQINTDIAPNASNTIISSLVTILMATFLLLN
jgi:hypothetical protein